MLPGAQGGIKGCGGAGKDLGGGIGRLRGLVECAVVEGKLGC